MLPDQLPATRTAQMHKEQEITKCRCWCDKGGGGGGKDAKMKQPHSVVQDYHM